MSEMADAFAKAKHAVGVLYDELQETRAHAAHILERVNTMGAIHDEAKGFLTEAKTLLDKVLGSRADGDVANADLRDQAKDLRDALKAAADKVDAEKAPVGGGDAHDATGRVGAIVG